MIFVARPHLRRLTLALLLLIASAEECPAKTNPSSSHSTLTAEGTDQSLAASILAAQVSEIAGSKLISRAKKEKRISTTVRIAVVAATAYNNNPRQTLNLALELTAAAAAAAPSYAEVITNAVSFAPAIAKIDAAQGQIRTAAFAAAKSPRGKRHSTRVAAVRQVEPASEAEETAPQPAAERTAMAEADQSDNEPAPPPRSRRRTQPDDADDEAMPPSSKGGKIAPDKNSNFVITADANVRHDDNLFLSDTNKVGDTIYSLSPGVVLQYGQNSLSHGSLIYNEAFTRYANKTAPNANLGFGQADFGYDNGDLNLSATAKYQQIYQNSRETAALGGQGIVRQDLFGVNASVEEHFTPKTSVKTGAIFNQTSYKAAGLVNNQDVTVPLKFYYTVTPKVSLSTGLDYRHSQTDTPGSAGKELYYNLGARGEFTPKLSGEFSIGERKRTSETLPAENLLSFTGSFNYDLTAKTSASLNFSRDFSTDAFGKSLKNSSYALRLSTNPTPQWQFSTGLTYQKVEYGLVSYFSNTTPKTTLTANRNDDYWVGDFQATYLFSNSLSTACDYTFRNNHSSTPTIPGAVFNDNLISLMLSWKY